jgi:hypothetical protein
MSRYYTKRNGDELLFVEDDVCIDGPFVGSDPIFPVEDKSLICNYPKFTHVYFNHTLHLEHREVENPLYRNNVIDFFKYKKSFSFPAR